MKLVDEAAIDGDPLTEAFFSAPPPPVEVDAFEWDASIPIDSGRVRAMYATAAIFVGSLVLLGGFLVHQKLIMPAPVELGATPPEIHWTVRDEAPALDPVPVQQAHAAQLAAPVLEASPVRLSAGADAVDSTLAAEATQGKGTATALSEPSGATTISSPRASARRAHAGAVARPKAPEARGGGRGGSDVDRALRQAHAALRAGSARLARGHAVNALALDPARADAYIVLGAARAALGDGAGAQLAYRLCAERASGPRVGACRALMR